MYSKAVILIESCLQTLSVGANLFVLVLGPAAIVWLIWFVFFHTRIWWLVPLYFVWYLYDFESPKYGLHMSVSFRRLRMFNYLVGYFPISIRKTAELNPSENYLIVNHPHGILSVGAFGNFLTDATSFSSLFPGIRSYLCTLDMNFYWPIRREYMQLLGKNEFVGVKSTVGLSSATSGAVSRSKESVSYLITRPGGGNAVVIVAGGAEEALESQPGAHRIILRERKGFVKVAIKYGVALVPSYSFGEVDLFRQVSNGKGSKLRSVQSAIGSILTFTTPLFYGRGAFGFRFGFLPFQRPAAQLRLKEMKTPREKK